MKRRDSLVSALENLKLAVVFAHDKRQQSDDNENN
jgi:hypothetical protein